MAGTTFKTGDADANLDSSTDRASRLRGLLEQVQARPARVTAPARTIAVEVDGVCIAQSECGPTMRYALPGDTRNVTLRDENGAARAYLMLEETETVSELDFDEGRIIVSLERTEKQLTLSVTHAG